MKKKILIITVIILLVIILFITFWYFGLIIPNYPSKEKYGIIGVDVSSYQGEIDWKVLVNQDIKFAFIKATEGSSFLDEKFKSNYENAKNIENLVIGAYHFFSYDSLGSTQADNFIKNVPKDENMLPPVIDIEFYGDKRKNIPDVKETQEQLDIMIKKLKEHYGKDPIIYATYKSYNLYIASNYKDNPIWIRDVYFYPNLKDGRKWTFWQFSDKVKLSGYKGKEKRIDLNVFNGNIEELNRLIGNIK